VTPQINPANIEWCGSNARNRARPRAPSSQHLFQRLPLENHSDRFSRIAVIAMR
jgi:hypothetical protein